MPLSLDKFVIFVKLYYSYYYLKNINFFTQGQHFLTIATL